VTGSNIDEITGPVRCQQSPALPAGGLTGLGRTNAQIDAELFKSPIAAAMVR
jgi:hypothetical protein